MLAGNLDSATTTLPIIAMAVVVAVSLTLREDAGTPGQWRLDRVDVAHVLLGGTLAGAMLASSTWGFLPAMGLIAIATLLRIVMAHGLSHPWPLARNMVISVAFAGVIAYLAFWPAIAAIQSTQRDMRTGPAIGLTEILTIHGIPLFVLLTWLIVRVAGAVQGSCEEKWTGRLTAALVVVVILMALAGAVALDSTTLLAMIVLLLGTVALWHLRSNPAQLLVAGMTGLAMVLLLMRNTTPMTADPFGFNSAQNISGFIWILFGVAMPAAFAWIVHGLGALTLPIRTIAGTAWAAGLAILIAAGMTYPNTTIRALVEAPENRPPTLDATAFLDSSSLFTAPGEQPALAGDRAAAEWLMENVSGLPVILEGTTPDYQLGGRISTMTGLPTVIGWNTPERMMRPGWGELVGYRQTAVNEMLGSRGSFISIEPLLRQYNVRLIYIGPLERAAYPEASLQKFAIAEENGSLSVLYASDDVTIYYYAG
jgi:uncharacterized membrane protein